MFDGLPLASIARFQAHVTGVASLLQAEVDRLHNTYPTRVSKARVNANEVCRVAPHLFRLGQVYVGSLGHGVDCPMAHPETITETFRLFEQLCLGNHTLIGLQGGVSAGKTSVLALFRILLGPLCALAGLRYAPQLVHDKYQSTVATSCDIADAFMELYGGIEFIRDDGKTMSIGRFTHNLREHFGKNAVRPVTSVDAMLQLRKTFGAHGYETIALCDDAHRLAQFDSVERKLWLGPSVESVTAAFGKAVITTMRPEYLPLACEVRPVARSPRYASPQAYHRGIKLADTVPLIDGLVQSADMPAQLARIIDANDASLYLRLGTAYDVALAQDFLRHAGIESIQCDSKIERSDVSDWCWHSHNQSKRFAIISYGPTPRFHRALPVSVQTFVDFTRESTPSAIRRGLCGSASGYGRGSSRIIMSGTNAAAIHHNNKAHWKFRHTGSLRMHVSEHIQKRIDFLADQPYEIDNDVEIDDLCRMSEQWGSIRVSMYQPN